MNTRHKTQQEHSAARNDERPASERSGVHIGWQVPAHLFDGRSGESFCGQSGTREEMTAAETRTYTSRVEYPLNRLSSREQVVSFANGLCKNCLQSYYTFSDKEYIISHLDVYSNSILNGEVKERLGFCHSCGFPIDPESCNQAQVNDEIEIYMCDECCMKNFEGILESVICVSDSNSATQSLLKQVRSRLAEEENDG